MELREIQAFDFDGLVGYLWLLPIAGDPGINPGIIEGLSPVKF